MALIECRKKSDLKVLNGLFDIPESKLDTTGITITSNRVTILGGGYYVDNVNNIAYLRIKLQSNYGFSSSVTQAFTGLPFNQNSTKKSQIAIATDDNYGAINNVEIYSQFNNVLAFNKFPTGTIATICCVYLMS